MMTKIRPQGGTTELYSPVPHELVDSAAYADLQGEAIRLLMIVARQWNGQNNGQLHASFSYCQARGIGSKSTLQKAVASLIAHGFLFRTRSHGFIDGKNIPARYACTWLPLTKNRKGLWCDGFVLNAYKKWGPEKNSEVQKVDHTCTKNCTFSLNNRQDEPVPKSVLSAPAKAFTESTESEPFEILAIKGGSDYMTAPLIRRGRHAQLLSVRSHLKTIH